MDRRTFLISSLLAVPGVGLAQQRVPNDWAREWPNTDFSRSSIDFQQIFSGGVPKDGIPALDGAKFAGGKGLSPREPVITVSLKGQAERAYPVRYLIWHEIVNDKIGNVPVAVTYCPLCNSALVFDRRAAGRTLNFGVSGKLRFSDMVMFDRETESWWQQFEGQSIIGALEGTKLKQLVSWMESLEAFQARNPKGLVMVEPSGFARAYGRNPYQNYDTSRTPFLYRGENPPHGIPPLMRVVRVGKRAWPLSRFEKSPVINEAGLKLSLEGVMASALDSGTISRGREIGVVRVRDAATGRDVVHEIVFAFSFHAFAPDGAWMLGN